MDLNFYSDLTDGTGQHDGEPEFLDPQSFNGFDSDNKVTLSHEWDKRLSFINQHSVTCLHCFVCLNYLKAATERTLVCVYILIYCSPAACCLLKGTVSVFFYVKKEDEI